MFTNKDNLSYMMSGPALRDVANLMRSQLTASLPIPTASFAGEIVIVTGANTGLGREAAKHFVRLGASKVILAVRTISKGEEARAYIEKETKKSSPGVMEVWPLDMGSYASVKAFVKRAEGLEKLDAVVLNAGIWPNKKEMLEDNEATITVNVISTYLLAHLLHPLLARTSLAHNTYTRFTVTDSALHKFATLKARHTKGNIFDALAAQPLGPKDYDPRYMDSKLLVMLYGRAFAAASPLSTGKGNVVHTLVNPGYCVSALRGTELPFGERMGQKVMARSTDEGARTLVDAVRPVGETEAKARHGAYVDDMKVKSPSAWLDSKEGGDVQAKVWKELNEILERVQPGVTGELGGK